MCHILMNENEGPQVYNSIGDCDRKSREHSALLYRNGNTILYRKVTLFYGDILKSHHAGLFVFGDGK